MDLPKSRQRYLRRANLPVRYQESSIANLTISTRVREAVGTFQQALVSGTHMGKGLLLWGQPGRGKTTVAAAVLRDALTLVPRATLGQTFDHDVLRPGYWMSYAAFVDMTKRTFTENEDTASFTALLAGLHCRSPRPWENVKVMALDDVGKEHSPTRGDGRASFSASLLHDLLRSRYDAASPSIVTTNLSPHEWTEYYGPAMASFIHEAFDLLEIGGKDRRA